MEEPIALPPFDFNESLSEDDNFLTWSTVLARMSFSKKGHMGAIVVSPPLTSSSDPTLPINLQPSASSSDAKSRVLIHGNNTPLLYNTNPKQVPEIHAEALCISISAKEGIRLKGSTIYVTFPPCHECFRLICGAGIKRCVYRKSISSPTGDAALVAAKVLGIELCGTGDFRWKDFETYRNYIEVKEEEERKETDQNGSVEINDGNEASSSSSTSNIIKTNGDETSTDTNQISTSDSDRLPTQEQLEKHREISKKREADSELRAREAWIKMGETTQVTRNRVKKWWERWNLKYKEAAQSLRIVKGQNSNSNGGESKDGKNKKQNDQGGKNKKGGKSQKNGIDKDAQQDEDGVGLDDQTMEMVEETFENQEKLMEMEEDEFLNSGGSRNLIESVEDSTDKARISPSLGKRTSSPSLDKPNVKEAKVEE